MKKLALSTVVAVLASPWAAQAQGFGGWGGWGGGHPEVSAPEMHGFSVLAAALIGVAGYLVVRSRYAQAKVDN